MSLARRPDRVDNTDPASARASAGQFGVLYPTIADFLTLEVWPDSGERRKPGTMMLFLQEGCVKAMLVDKEAQEVAFLSADGLEALLEAVELALKTGSGDWRPDRRTTGKKRA